MAMEAARIDAEGETVDGMGAATVSGPDRALGASIELTALEPAACMFKSLGDPTRLAIIQHLALGEHRVVDLVAHLGLAQSTVSAHLACLKGCDLVTSRPVGRASMFSLKHPELLAVLGAAENLLTGTGDAVTLCPRSGTSA